MNDRRIGVAGLAGLVLVVVGSLLLLEIVLGPVLRPIFRVVSLIGWPLVLIGIGVILLNRGNVSSAGATSSPSGTALRRSRTDRVVGGVIGGFAERTGVSSSLLRVAYAVLTVMSGVWTGFVLYVIAMLLIPEESAFERTTAPVNTSAPVPPAPPVPQAPGTPDVPPAPQAGSQAAH